MTEIVNIIDKAVHNSVGGGDGSDGGGGNDGGGDALKYKQHHQIPL